MAEPSANIHGVARCAHCCGEIAPRVDEDLLRALSRVGVVPRLVTGRPRRWCSPACKRRGYRRRAAGLPEDAFPDGARRGPVPLGQLTAAEQRAVWIEQARLELERTVREARS